LSYLVPTTDGLNNAKYNLQIDLGLSDI